MGTNEALLVGITLTTVLESTISKYWIGFAIKSHSSDFNVFAQHGGCML